MSSDEDSDSDTHSDSDTGCKCVNCDECGGSFREEVYCEGCYTWKYCNCENKCGNHDHIIYFGYCDKCDLIVHQDQLAYEFQVYEDGEENLYYSLYIIDVPNLKSVLKIVKTKYCLNKLTQLFGIYKISKIDYVNFCTKGPYRASAILDYDLLQETTKERIDMLNLCDDISRIIRTYLPYEDY